MSPNSREFIDGQHCHWQVREAPDGWSGGSRLIFESVTAVRVVRDFPADWWTLSAGELEELSWRR